MTQITQTGVVVGMKYHKGALVVLSMLPREVACMAIRDPQNKFDRNAIAIKVSTEKMDRARIKAETGEDVPEWFMIGHIEKQAAARIAPMMDKEPTFVASIDTSRNPVVSINWAEAPVGAI